MDIREKVFEAFKLLRKQGLLCHANFLCCQSCASYDLSKRMKVKKDVIGYVYWHHQDQESFDRDGSLYLAYGAKAKADNASVKIGTQVVEAFKAVGLHPIWNGDVRDRILLSEEAEKNQEVTR